ncbi:hypothetical protein HDK77DRAFT_457052 [Phyllosticta capitalensis]|uniref:uncharacterized protein n=1 Tax=Phyllosticta capitalensis TaxID=121624 RepID=UPI00313190DF
MIGRFIHLYLRNSLSLLLVLLDALLGGSIGAAAFGFGLPLLSHGRSSSTLGLISCNALQVSRRNAGCLPESVIR